MDMESDEFCWICLDDASKGQLISPCRCPRKVHPTCLARWQLQQAGRAEETQCRFCNSQLADWKASLTPEPLKPEVERVQPIMVVYFEGEIHRIPVKQGNEGLHEFTSRIRDLFRLPEDVDISLTFGCKEPMSGQHLKLEGIGAFDAAVHCASVAAAERQHKLRSTGGGSHAPDLGSGSGSSAEEGTAGTSGRSPSSQLSAGGNSSSGGSAASSASAPSATQDSAQQQRTSNHCATTYLRHSTGSSWPATPGSASAGPTSPGTASPSLSPQATAHALDGQHSLDTPSPFMQQGLASPWGYSHREAGHHVPLATPLMMDEQLLLRQHLNQLSHTYYSPLTHYPAAAAPSEPQLRTRQGQLPSHGSLDVVAPSTPIHVQDVHAPATPLPSLLSAPSVSNHVATCLSSTFHVPSALSAENLLTRTMHQGAVTAHSPQPVQATTGATPGCEPSSPALSMDGMSGADGQGHAYARSHALPGGVAARRARRSSSRIGEALPLHQSPAQDAGVEGEAQSGSPHHSDAASAEAMAFAASFTGRLRCSIKALSRKFVRTINTGLFTHHQRPLPHGAAHTAAPAPHILQHPHEGPVPETQEEAQYRLHEDAMRYSAIPAVHQQQYMLEQQPGSAPNAAGQHAASGTS